MTPHQSRQTHSRLCPLNMGSCRCSPRGARGSVHWSMLIGERDMLWGQGGGGAKTGAVASAEADFVLLGFGSAVDYSVFLRHSKINT